ncbi:hypothetical protein R5R35_003336 [Gryllus longicercus]|uniref:Glucosidase 2 subunit beta n=1 Tax=Gryllus longicercus TaxID=2509291 RepID=A0AAN9VV13_9ORTH
MLVIGRIGSFERMFYNAHLVFSSLVVLLQVSHASEILRPRGVSISKASFYVPERDFTCMDGSATVPFIYVNDDYCDCEDGSDEPGTPACPNGTFHCTNAGHKPLNIPSSRVNDGICDCCDTSDEYASQASCVNNCNELGRAARAEAQKLAELTKQGSELRIQLSKKGKQIRQEKQEKLNQLEKDLGEAERLKKEKEGLKIAAEDLEGSALKQYQQEEEERKQAQNEEEKRENEQEAFEYFHKLDSNQDGKLQLSELQVRQTFDSNRDGEVSDDEAKFLLNQQEEMSWEDFVISGWPRMKPLLMLDKGLFQGPDSTHTAKQEGDNNQEKEHISEGKEEELDHSEDDEDEEEEEEEDDKLYEPHPEEEDPSAYEEDEEEGETANEAKGEVEEAASKYDEETQRLINEANQARSEFEEADRNVRDIQREIQQIKDTLLKDYGSEEEFAPLDGECFEFTDNEYIYKLCPFDQATQRSKSGGADTRLGSWSGWIGADDDKYRTMLFDGGQSCWNGPQRSTKVKLLCGTEHALKSVSEPNRCEYFFEFVTPAVCLQLDSGDKQDNIKDEL